MVKMGYKFSILGLILFFLLYFELMWFPYFFSIFISEQDIYYVELIGLFLRFLFIVLLYYSLKYFLDKHSVENTRTKGMNSGEVATPNITKATLFYFLLLYLSIPQLFGFFLYSLGIEFPVEEVQLNGDFWVDYVNAVVFAPIVEEIVFRWLFLIIFNTLYFGKNDFFIKATVNSVLFSLAHWLGSYQEVIENPNYIVSIPSWAFFGFLAFYIYYFTRRLDLVIILHAAVNFVIMTHNFFVLWFSIDNDIGYNVLRSIISIFFLSFIFYSNPSATKSVLVKTINFLRSKLVVIFMLLSALVLVVIGFITLGVYRFIFSLGILGASLFFLLFMCGYSITLIWTFYNDNQIIVFE